ncbi:MAG: hypothetical protein CMO01_30360 [Thalassobius sp.]|nr:hypothetical protein [Thalassovita sp.]
MLLNILNKPVLSLRLIVLCLFISGYAFSQTESAGILIDPLKKPEVWEKLKINPYNDALWTAYFNEDLFTLTKEQYIEYNTWKAQLVEQLSKENEKKELELLKRREEYLANRYSYKKLTESDFEELSQNVSKNFPIIEQYFKEQFEALGESYQSYAEAHPEKEYNHTKWVEENEEKLMNLKMN